MKHWPQFSYTLSKKDCIRIGIQLTVLLVLFVPGHMFNWAVEWIWLGVQVFIALFWFLVMHRGFVPTAGIRPSAWVVLFVLFTILGFLGTLYSSFGLGFQITTADLPDLLRFLISIPLALFIGSAIDKSASEGVSQAFKGVVLFNVLTSALLLFGVPGASDAVMLIYADAKVTYDFGYIRIGIPFTNPNFAALIFVLLLSYFLFFKQSLIYAVLCLVSLFNTGSRSGFLAAIPILLLAYISLLRIALFNLKILTIVIVLHAMVLYYISTVVETAEGFSRLLELTEALQNREIGQVNTASIRMDLVANALKFIKRSPLFGVGPGRSYGLEITDSQLVSWPLMYGIPGAIVIAGFFGFLFLNIARRAEQRAHVMAALATFLSFFLMLATGDFMKNYRMFFVTVLVAHCMYLVVVPNVSTRMHRLKYFRTGSTSNY